MLFVWENLVLHWQVHPRTVDEVDDGESILEGNLLGSKVFLPVMGNQAPALTVASLATTKQG